MEHHHHHHTTTFPLLRSFDCPICFEPTRGSEADLLMCPTCPSVTRLHPLCALPGGKCPQQCGTTLIKYVRTVPAATDTFIKIEE